MIKSYLHVVGGSFFIVKEIIDFLAVDNLRQSCRLG